MSRVLKAGIVVFVLGCAGVAFAADEHFMIPEEDTLELILLRQKSVRDELKLKDSVEEHVRKHAAQQWKKAKEVSSLNEKEQEKKFDAMAKENREFLRKHLTSQQLQRLDEIALQVAGLLYVTRTDIAEKLKLSSDQIQKARTLRKEARDEFEKLLESKDSKDRHKEIVAMWDVNHSRLEKLLNESQRKTWKELTGPEFKGEFVYTREEASSQN